MGSWLLAASLSAETLCYFVYTGPARTEDGHPAGTRRCHGLQVSGEEARMG